MRPTRDWEACSYSVCSPKGEIDVNPLLVSRSVFPLGQDIGFIERKAGDTDPPEQVMRRWFRARHDRLGAPVPP